MNGCKVNCNTAAGGKGEDSNGQDQQSEYDGGDSNQDHGSGSEGCGDCPSEDKKKLSQSNGISSKPIKLSGYPPNKQQIRQPFPYPNINNNSTFAAPPLRLPTGSMNQPGANGTLPPNVAYRVPCFSPYFTRYTNPLTMGPYATGYAQPAAYPPRVPASPPNSSTSTSGSGSGSQSGSGSVTGSGSSGSGEQLSKTNLYIRGLTNNTTDKDLLSMCSPFGNIISTKAILDKNTNKCKGYGFVDFESPTAAEAAVKTLQSQGVQAQMAKQQEQDPTNLYIANLPLFMSEPELENILGPYGTVISTRILRDSGMQSRGVGFARMESKEKCENIISVFNGHLIPGSKEPLLVKFADGGNKKRNQYKNQEHRLWRDGEGMPLSYEQAAIPQNGVAAQLVAPMTSFQRPYTGGPVSPYPLQAGQTWLPHQYIVQPPLALPSSLEHTTAIHYGPIMPPLTTQMSQLQLSNTSVNYMASAAQHAYAGPAPAPIYQQPAQLVQSLQSVEDVSGVNPSEDQHPYQVYNQAK